MERVRVGLADGVRKVAWICIVMAILNFLLSIRYCARYRSHICLMTNASSRQYICSTYYTRSTCSKLVAGFKGEKFRYYIVHARMVSRASPCLIKRAYLEYKAMLENFMITRREISFNDSSLMMMKSPCTFFCFANARLLAEQLVACPFYSDTTYTYLVQSRQQPRGSLLTTYMYTYAGRIFSVNCLT